MMKDKKGKVGKGRRKVEYEKCIMGGDTFSAKGQTVKTIGLISDTVFSQKLLLCCNVKITMNSK